MAEVNGSTTHIQSPSSIQPLQSQQPQQSQQSQQANSSTPPPQQAAATNNPFFTAAPTPANSLSDTGTGTRPRDTRTIHMVLAALGVTAYQERVPLQLLDFAYRYTSSVLSDALHLSAEGYVNPTGTGSSSRTKGGEEGQISIGALRLATSSRQGYQFSSALPKETLLELAGERNKIKLPVVEGPNYGVRLPHERFCLTGTGWDLVDEWESDGAEEGVGEGDEGVDGVNGETKEEKEDAEMDEGYDQVFGTEEDDQEMEDG